MRERVGRWRKARLCLVVLSESRRGNQETKQSYGQTKMGIDSSREWASACHNDNVGKSTR